MKERKLPLRKRRSYASFRKIRQLATLFAFACTIAIGNLRAGSIPELSHARSGWSKTVEVELSPEAGEGSTVTVTEVAEDFQLSPAIDGLGEVVRIQISSEETPPMGEVYVGEVLVKTESGEPHSRLIVNLIDGVPQVDILQGSG